MLFTKSVYFLCSESEYVRHSPGEIVFGGCGVDLNGKDSITTSGSESEAS